MSRDDTNLHDEASVNKRRKLINGNSNRRQDRPQKIFAPYRVNSTTVEGSAGSYVLILIPLRLDRRTCFFDGCSVQLNSFGKDHLPNYDLCREMPSHLRSSEGLKFGLSDTSPNSVQYYVDMFMEGSSVCSVGRRDTFERGGRMGFQERQKG